MRTLKTLAIGLAILTPTFAAIWLVVRLFGPLALIVSSALVSVGLIAMGIGTITHGWLERRTTSKGSSDE